MDYSIFTCLLNKNFEISLSKSTHKEQFHSKLKTIKRSNNRLISREHLSNQINKISCDDDVDAVVVRIKRNKFKLEFKYFTQTNS